MALDLEEDAIEGQYIGVCGLTTSLEGRCALSLDAVGLEDVAEFALGVGALIS